MSKVETPSATNPANPANALAPLAELAEGQAVATRDDKGRFLTGNSGGGRPKGAKNRLTELVLKVVVADFEEYGADTLARLREGDPATYLRLVGALVPRELILQREQCHDVDYADLSYDEMGKLVEAERRRKFLQKILDSL